jgi:Family of unknown function (DUF5898)
MAAVDDEAPTDYSDVVEFPHNVDSLTDDQIRQRTSPFTNDERALEELEQKIAELEEKLSVARQSEVSVLSFLLNPSEVHNVAHGAPLIDPVASFATRTQIYAASQIGHWEEYGPGFKEAFSPLWKAVQYFPGSSYCSSDADVALRVGGLLLSVIAAMGIGGRYSVVIPGDHMGSDMAIVDTTTALTVGIIKVAMPGNSDAVFGRFENGRLQNENEPSAVAGQMYEKLSSLQTTGSQTPFALLTNWNEWQLISVENFLPFLLGELDSPTVVLEDSATPAPSTWRRSLREFVQCLVTKFKPLPKQILVSDIVRLKDGLKLGKFLEHTIDLMIQTSVHRYERDGISKMIGQPVLYSRSASNCGITHFTMVNRYNLPEMKTESHPSEDILEFFILKELEQSFPPPTGARCKALGVDGSVCVIKIFYEYSDGKLLTPGEVVAQAKHEASLWNEIYEEYFPAGFCRVLDLVENKQVHLMIPFVESIKSDEFKSLAHGRELENALKAFASCNFRHNDLRWHHIGRAPASKGNIIVLMDLGNVEAMKHSWGPSEQEGWVKATLENLRSKEANATFLESSTDSSVSLVLKTQKRMVKKHKRNVDASS